MLPLLGCLSNKVSDCNDDNSLFFLQDKDGTVRMSSLNSSQQIKITKQEHIQDTLFICYKRGVFISSENIVNIKENTKYLKCANQIFRIERNGKNIRIIRKDEQ